MVLEAILLRVEVLEVVVAAVVAESIEALLPPLAVEDAVEATDAAFLAF